MDDDDDDAFMREEREGGGGTRKDGTERDTKDGEGAALLAEGKKHDGVSGA